jgi:hypothetical protein
MVPQYEIPLFSPWNEAILKMFGIKWSENGDTDEMCSLYLKIDLMKEDGRRGGKPATNRLSSGTACPIWSIFG